MVDVRVEKEFIEDRVLLTLVILVSGLRLRLLCVEVGTGDEPLLTAVILVPSSFMDPCSKFLVGCSWSTLSPDSPNSEVLSSDLSSLSYWRNKALSSSAMCWLPYLARLVLCSSLRWCSRNHDSPGFLFLLMVTCSVSWLVSLSVMVLHMLSGGRLGGLCCAVPPGFLIYP